MEICWYKKVATMTLLLAGHIMENIISNLNFIDFPESFSNYVKLSHI